MARETGNGISLIHGFEFPVLLIIFFCKCELSAAAAASYTVLAKAEAEKFPVNFPDTGNICGRAVSARLRPPPFSLLCGGTFRIAVYSCDIGGEMPGLSRKRDCRRTEGCGCIFFVLRTQRDIFRLPQGLPAGWQGGVCPGTRHATRSAAQAIVRILPDGRVFVGSGTQDLGTGTYTIIAETAAETLGLDPGLVEVKLGDSMLPRAPASTGSQSAASVCPAVRNAARQALLQLVNLAIADDRSPLRGMSPEDLGVHDGRVFLKLHSSTGETFADIIAGNGGKPVEALEGAEPGADRASYTANSFGAVFVEVAVDCDTCMVKVRRVVGTYDIGTLMNKKTGLNQLIGGIVWGVSFALHEEAHIDPVFGRTVNENFAEYHVPVNADIGQIDVTVLDIPDMRFYPLGARGIGEIAITGVAAAIANAIYNATGKRVRQFPITSDKIMDRR
jgi:CO/xanthine dehydrogenase Mo-binding subunit